MLMDVVRERRAAGMRWARRRDVAAVGEDGGDGERTSCPNLIRFSEWKKSRVAVLLEVSTGVGEHGGHEIEPGHGHDDASLCRRERSSTRGGKWLLGFCRGRQRRSGVALSARGAAGCTPASASPSGRL